MTIYFVNSHYLCNFRKLRNTSDGAERVMDTMQQMARSFSTRLVQMGMAYESTVESADNRIIFQKFSKRLRDVDKLRESLIGSREIFTIFKTDSSPIF